MPDSVDEIRINSRYSHLYRSVYEEGSETYKDDSVPLIHKRGVLTEDYLRRMIKGIGYAPQIMPPNCRYIEKCKQGYIVVIEEPPAFRTIKIKMGFAREVEKLKEKGLLEKYGYDESFQSDNLETKSFTLALPYCVFILFIDNDFCINGGQIFFRVARISGLADYLMKAPLNNISDSQYICFGDSINGRSVSLNAAVDKAITSFWSAPFNTDYSYNYRDYANVAGVNSFMEWAALSAIDPMFIYQVQWIKIPMTIAEAVDEIKRQSKLTSINNIGYVTLKTIFTQPTETGKEIEAIPGIKRSRRKLYYDIATGASLSPGYFVHVGDPFYIKNGKTFCYINSFISFENSDIIKYIRVEREDGRLIIYKFTKAFQKFLEIQSKKARYEEQGILKNGVVVKEDDILVIKNAYNQDTYKQVSYIRKTPEGFTEGRFGDGFYILENTEGTIFDVSQPKYNDIALDKDEVYFLINEVRGIPFSYGSIVKYEKVSVTRMGALTLEMKHIDPRQTDERFNLELNRSEQKLLKLSDCVALPPVFRIGREIKQYNEVDSRHFSYPLVWSSEYGTIFESHYTSLEKPKANKIKEYLLTEDTFKIESHDMNIEFKIGDKVVVADWENPTNMLSVKVIQSFMLDESRRDVTFVMMDKNGDLQSEKYVDGYCGIINVGRIRKIENTFGMLKTGMKIKSNVVGIPYFPKKDTNIIIGFITDTDGINPLVLCSNCCTLWYNDVVEKFDIIPITDPKWQKLTHAPIDVAKIKYQAGDIIQGKRDYKEAGGWIVYCSGYKGTDLKMSRLHRYTRDSADNFTVDKYILASTQFDCIPNPRISLKDQNELPLVPALPNFHGRFYSSRYSRFRFLNDERSLINVQNSTE
jgi:hypothetical protein